IQEAAACLAEIQRLGLDNIVFPVRQFQASASILPQDVNLFVFVDTKGSFRITLVNFLQSPVYFIGIKRHQAFEPGLCRGADARRQTDDTGIGNFPQLVRQDGRSCDQPVVGCHVVPFSASLECHIPSQNKLPWGSISRTPSRPEYWAVVPVRFKGSTTRNRTSGRTPAKSGVSHSVILLTEPSRSSLSRLRWYPFRAYNMNAMNRIITKKGTSYPTSVIKTIPKQEPPMFQPYIRPTFFPQLPLSPAASSPKSHP